MTPESTHTPPEDRPQQAVEYFMQGYNCSQSVVKAYADLYGFTQSQAEALSCGFGGGVGRMRMMCGAVSGIVTLVGMHLHVPGEDPRQARTRVYKVVQELLEEFRKQNGSVICAEILGLKGPIPKGQYVPSERNAEYYAKRPCAAKIESAARIFDEYLRREKTGNASAASMSS